MVTKEGSNGLNIDYRSVPRFQTCLYNSKFGLVTKTFKKKLKISTFLKFVK